jgi:hypothetical protein
MRESHWILQENTGNTWNMEAVFRSGISRIFSDDFRKNPAGKHWKLLESTGKDQGNSRPEYSFQLPSIFRYTPAVSRRTSFTWEREEKEKRNQIFSFDYSLVLLSFYIHWHSISFTE